MLYDVNSITHNAPGVDVSGVKKEDAGRLLADTLRKIMHELKVPNGLSALGYSSDIVPTMVEGAMPQVQATFIILFLFFWGG